MSDQFQIENKNIKQVINTRNRMTAVQPTNF